MIFDRRYGPLLSHLSFGSTFFLPLAGQLEHMSPISYSILFLPPSPFLIGPGNLAREHLGLKVDAKEFDDAAPLPVPAPASTSLLGPQLKPAPGRQGSQQPFVKAAPAKEEFPKQIQEVMLCSQQAHTEWEKAGKPEAPHPAYLSKMEIANILKGMIDQYLAFKEQVWEDVGLIEFLMLLCCHNR